MEKPTRAEAVAHLLGVVKADYTSAVKKRKETCQDCGGLGVTFAKSKKGKGGDASEHDGESGDKVSHCHSCDGMGYVEVDAFDFETLDKALKPFVQGFKIGPKGAILPDLASKDKAADQLLKVIGLGWGDDFQRDKYGSDIRPAKIDLSTKEGLISYYEAIITGAGDPNVKMTALKEIAKLRGFITEENDMIDAVPLTAVDLQKALAEHIQKPKD